MTVAWTPPSRSLRGREERDRPDRAAPTAAEAGTGNASCKELAEHPVRSLMHPKLMSMIVLPRFDPAWMLHSGRDASPARERTGGRGVLTPANDGSTCRVEALR